VLPYDPAEFARDSVAYLPGTAWEERHQVALRRAAPVVVASPNKLAGGRVSYDYANAGLQGLAGGRAGELGTGGGAPARWGGRPGDGPGGTATRVGRWKELGVRVEHIDAAELLRRECPELVREPPPDAPAEPPWPPVADPEAEPAVKAMLFADAVHYSKLTEE